MKAINLTVGLVRRIAVLVVGLTILAIGVVMIVAPGPAIILIPVGLAILGLEFAWARLWLRRLRRNISANNSNRHADRAERHRRRHMGG
jgi:tellurite resistance protein TerC